MRWSTPRTALRLENVHELTRKSGLAGLLTSMYVTSLWDTYLR